MDPYVNNIDNTTFSKKIKDSLGKVYNNSTNEYRKITLDELNIIVKNIPSWKIINENNGQQKLVREFSFSNFPNSMEFSYLVALISQILNHHPVIQIDWNTVTLELHTWALNNTISNHDFNESILFDQLYKSCCK